MMASSSGLQSRPGGLSDEEDEDDDYPVLERGFTDEDDDDSRTWCLKPSKDTPLDKQFTANISTTGSISSFCPQQEAALGRGRGRGRGIRQQQQIQGGNEVENSEEMGHIWGGTGGFGKGRSGRHRRQRSRSGSSSPSRSDKQKLKETLLKRVPDFGGGADTYGKEKMLWAKEVSRNLKFWWEQDQKIKITKEFQTSKETKLEMSLVRKLSGDEDSEENCEVGGGEHLVVGTI